MTKTILFNEWASPMTGDIDAATRSVIACALSLHVPRYASETAFGKLWTSIENAAARGVEVKIILPKPSHIHPATLQNHTMAKLAFERGVRVTFATGAELLHAKAVVVDGVILWVGSGNFTGAAAHRNNELYLRTVAPAIAGKAEKMIREWGGVA